MGGQKVGTHHWYGPWVVKIHQNLRCSLGLQRQGSRFRHRWWEVRLQPPHHSPPFGGSAGGFGIPRLRLGYTTATISEGFLECGDPLNHPFMDGFSSINRPAIGGAPWLWKSLHDHDSDGFSWTLMDVNGFGISSHIFRCLVGRFARYCDKFGIVFMDLGGKGRYRIIF